MVHCFFFIMGFVLDWRRFLLFYIPFLSLLRVCIFTGLILWPGFQRTCGGIDLLSVIPPTPSWCVFQHWPVSGHQGVLRDAVCPRLMKVGILLRTEAVWIHLLWAPETWEGKWAGPMCPPEMGKYQQGPHRTARKQQLAACGRDVRDPLLSLCAWFDLCSWVKHSQVELVLLYHCFHAYLALWLHAYQPVRGMCAKSSWENILIPFPLLLLLPSSLLCFPAPCSTGAGSLLNAEEHRHLRACPTVPAHAKCWMCFCWPPGGLGMLPFLLAWRWHMLALCGFWYVENLPSKVWRSPLAPLCLIASTSHFSFHL